MRAYSCIDRHGRWTEIPTRVSISTFRDPGPAQSPSPYPENDSDVIDIEPEYSNRASRRDATACAALPRTSRGSPAQAFSVTERDSDEPDTDPDTELEELEDEVLEEHATAYAASLAQAVEKLTADSNHRGRTATATASAVSSEPISRSDGTACAAPPAQAFPVSLRHPGPYGISAPSAIGSNPAPQPGFSRINLIYPPAIRNDGKP